MTNNVLPVNYVNQLLSVMMLLNITSLGGIRVLRVDRYTFGACQILSRYHKLSNIVLVSR